MIKVADFIREGKTSEFTDYMAKYKDDVELVEIKAPLTVENFYKIKEAGCQGLIYFSSTKEDEDYFKALSEAGIKYICTASVGYDHFNIPAMKKYGIKGANVPFYSPNAIAEHAVLLALSVLRNFRQQIIRIEDNRYRLDGLMGREMRNMKVGIVGTGRIGFTSIKCLSGFGPKEILAYDPYENPAVKEFARYTSLDELFRESDVILFHCIYNESNHHMVNADSIKKMKDGVVLVNAARGGLFDTAAVLAGVKSGKIGGLALDVIEGEDALYSQEKFDKCPIPELEELLKCENVIFTNHSAFFTDEADRNIMDTVVENFVEYSREGKCQRELVK